MQHFPTTSSGAVENKKSSLPFAAAAGAAAALLSDFHSIFFRFRSIFDTSTVLRSPLFLGLLFQPLFGMQHLLIFCCVLSGQTSRCNRYVRCRQHGAYSIRKTHNLPLSSRIITFALEFHKLNSDECASVRV